jgi:N-acetylmuramic acid 6-phosphate etherase
MDHLQTEARNPASMDLDKLTPLEFVRLMNREDSRVIEAVESQSEIIAQAIEKIAEKLGQGGRLLYVGAGTSGRLGVLDATECPPTFSTPPGLVVGVIAGGPTALTQSVEGAEDHPEFGERDLRAHDVSAKDAVVGIATSGRTPYVLGALQYARDQGACTIALACNPESDLEPVADLTIAPIVGPEVVSGSTRLNAGTATKLVLNMLSTGVMVRLGKTFGNLMVDLRATNSKLRARTNRIVRILTGLSADEADDLLKRCDKELKTALVVERARLSPEEARQRLAAVGGRVHLALECPARTSFLATQAQGVAPASPLSPRGVGGEGGEINPADLFIGIDGGGSHTTALLAKRSQAGSNPSYIILGRSRAGPSNLQAVGNERAFQSLNEAIVSAFTAARLPGCSVHAACLGLAGAGRPDDRQLILEWAKTAGLADQVEVTTDVDLLLAAGTPQGWGIALVAGTGSIAFGRSADGHSARAGGWGHLLGDEGSGYALALSGLRAVARAADGRSEQTRLKDDFLQVLRLKEPQELIPTLHQGSMDRAALSALATVVLEAGAAGDVIARKIVDENARELAAAGASVARQLGFDGKHVPLALSGGLLLSSERYRQRVLAAITTFGPDPVALVLEPAEGAIRLALKAMTPRMSAYRCEPGGQND